MSTFKTLLIVGIVLAVICIGKCDSWASPHRFESFSENSNFVAVIQPATKTNKATATVYHVNTTAQTQLWQVTLSNPSAPLSVFLSDDGQNIVTLDNWASVGYGDDVVVLYNSGRQTAKYSLEEFAPPPQARTNGLIERVKEKIDALRNKPSVSTRMAYHDLFSHSTSSRWWNEDSIQFVWPQTNSAFFCLWLDWDQRWVSWKLSNGSLVDPTKKQTTEWNAEGRRRSLNNITSGNATPPAYNFLGRLRIKEDRPLIERWLADPQFGTGSTQSSSSDNDAVHFVLTASSHNREKADWILARWDGATTKRSSHDIYTYLGMVKGVVNLSASPQKTDGFLRVQLVPNGTTWSSALPEHYLVADLRWSRPTSFSGGRISDLPLSTNVEFAINGVTPGSYRVQALWDKEAPYCVSTNRICDPSHSDYIATNSPVVHVRKGEASERVIIDCKTLVE
jgi:hypothetical protein